MDTEEKGGAGGPRDMGGKPSPNSDSELLSLTKQSASWISAGGGFPSLLLQWTSGNRSNSLGRKHRGGEGRLLDVLGCTTRNPEADCWYPLGRSPC